MHPKLSQNILKQVLGEKRSTENADMLSLQMIDKKKEENEPYCLGTVEISWCPRLLFSLSFHAGLSQVNNLCNILSQSVHSNSLVTTGI